MRVEKDLIKRSWEHRCPSCETPLSWEWTDENHIAPPNAYALSKALSGAAGDSLW